MKIKNGDGSLVGESYAGCTANVTLIHNNTIYCANAGDSRSILCKNGEVNIVLLLLLKNFLFIKYIFTNK